MRAWFGLVVVLAFAPAVGCKSLTEGECQRLAAGAKPVLTRVREHLGAIAQALPTTDFTRGRDSARALAEQLATDLGALEQVDPKAERLRTAWRGLTGELVEMRLALGNIANAYESLRVEASDSRAADELRAELEHLRQSMNDYAKAGKEFDGLCR